MLRSKTRLVGTGLAVAAIAGVGALAYAAIAGARKKAREAAMEEYRRLLYVALTRAEERLYIAGFHGAEDPNAGCWAAMTPITRPSRRSRISARAGSFQESEFLRRRVGLSHMGLAAVGKVPRYAPARRLLRAR